MTPDIRMIPYGQLAEPPFPMREQFGEMPFDELCQSIGRSGIKQPLRVRPVNGHFEIMSGHRRYKAAGVCALAEVPCIVVECDEVEAVDEMIAENTGREDVSATEEGRFFCDLTQRFQWSEEEVARRVRKSVGYVSDRIALVTCDPGIADAVRDKLISYAAAKELLRVNPYTAALALRCAVDTIPQEKAEQIHKHRAFLLDLCVRCGATARVAQNYVEQWKRSLVPINPFESPSNGGAEQVAAPSRMPRCICCGRDSDPQNMLDLKVHFWEKEGIMRVLRSAGMEVYE